MLQKGSETEEVSKINIWATVVIFAHRANESDTNHPFICLIHEKVTQKRRTIYPLYLHVWLSHTMSNVSSNPGNLTIILDNPPPYRVIHVYKSLVSLDLPYTTINQTRTLNTSQISSTATARNWSKLTMIRFLSVPMNWNLKDIVHSPVVYIFQRKAKIAPWIKSSLMRATRIRAA